jgi:predicted nucleic acid-binding protein
MSSSAVVDANFSVHAVMDTELSPLAIQVWRRLLSNGTKLYAPGLWCYETTSVIHRYHFTGRITGDEAEEALAILNRMQVRFIPDDLRLRQAAMRWASLLHQKAAYDGFYLAAAEQLSADFWTADRSLANNARQVGINWAHWIGD